MSNVADLVAAFLTLEQQEQGEALLGIAQRWLSDMGAAQVKFGVEQGDPLVVCFARGAQAVMLAQAHEKIKSLTCGVPESQTTLRFTNGQWVRITQGHYLGLRGRVVGYLNAKALMVKLPGMGRPMAVMADSLESCDPPKGT